MDIFDQLKRKLVWQPAGLVVMAVMLSACGGSEPETRIEAVQVALPVSLKEVKVAMVKKVSDPRWTETWNQPQTEFDWRELEHLAYQVELGGTLLQYPGTGPRDREWTSNSDWQALAKQLSQDGARAVNAVRSRNRELMDRAGGQLIETCEACHRAFQPDLPTLDRLAQMPARPVSL
jgi:cytochrome c556